MKISLTQDDIDNGLPDDCEDCPVALAIKRVNPDAYVTAYSHEITIDRVKFEVPLSVSVFINNFDDGRHVKPFEFDLTS